MADVVVRVIGEDRASKQLKGIDSSLLNMAKSLGLVVSVAAIVRKALDFGKEATLLAARVSTLGAVTEVMGRTAGKSAEEVRDLEKAIQAQGITTQASRQALAQMMRAEIDLAKATDLARLAQDAAVISGTNSSEAFEKLTQIIGTGNTYMARRMGLLVDFNGAYQALAATLKKPVDSLTQLERVQARTNEVMAQGVTIAGAYEAAMETTGKKLTSFPRHWEELQLALGAFTEEGLGSMVDAATKATDVLTDNLKVHKILNDAVKKGTISQLERVKVLQQAWGPLKTYAETLESLSELEEKNTELVYSWSDAQAAAGEAGVGYKDILIDLSYGSLGLSEAIVILNERLAEEKTRLDGIAVGAADADVAMLLLVNRTYAFIGTGEEMEDTLGSIGDGMERLDQRTYGTADAYYALRASADSAKLGLEGVNTAIGNSIEAMREQIAWMAAGGPAIEAAAKAVFEAAASGDMPLAEADLKLDTLQQAAIDVQLEIGKIEPSEAVDKLMDLGLGPEEARAQVALLQSSIFALEGKTIVIDIVTRELTEGSGIYSQPKSVESPSQPDWEGATGLNFTVPPGYPGDSGLVGVTSGEQVTVTPSGQSADSASSVALAQLTAMIARLPADISRSMRDTMAMVQ